MLDEQFEIFAHRKKEWAAMLETIGSLDIGIEWIKLFTSLCLYRGFRKLDNDHVLQMQNIAAVNSEAVMYLALQDKRAGLHTLEDLSVKVTDEETRLKAVQLIMNKGIKESKSDIDLIIQAAYSTPSLFDHEERKDQ